MISARNVRSRRGYTLVELLTVVMIISILLAIVLPLYINALTDSSRKGCRANMQSIANAAQAWKVKNRMADFSTVTLSALTPDLGQLPRCPDAGTYLITTTGTVTNDSGVAIAIPAGSLGVSCNKINHNGFIPGMMGR